MKLFIIDAFTDKVFHGNQAGVVLIDERDENTFAQGEAMGKPSIVLSRVDNEGRVFIAEMQLYQ